MFSMSNYLSNTKISIAQFYAYIYLYFLLANLYKQRPRSAKKVRSTQNIYLYWHEGSRSKFKPKIKKYFFWGFRGALTVSFTKMIEQPDFFPLWFLEYFLPLQPWKHCTKWIWINGVVLEMVESKNTQMSYCMSHLSQSIPEQRTETRCFDFTLKCMTLSLVKPLNSSVALPREE